MTVGTCYSLLYWLSTAAAREEMETLNQFIQQTCFNSFFLLLHNWNLGVGRARTKTKKARTSSFSEPTTFNSSSLTWTRLTKTTVNINTKGRWWWRHPSIVLCFVMVPPSPHIWWARTCFVDIIVSWLPTKPSAWDWLTWTLCSWTESWSDC